MAEVVKPHAFNATFTVSLNAAGEPVRRTLGEMTAGEVMLAIEWLAREEARLDREAEPWAALAGESDADWIARINPAPGEAARIVALLRESGEASERCGRLLAMVHARMPQWQQTPEVGLAQALRRWWPGGRAA